MRWTNRNHPQTLQIGVFLLYFDAVFGVLGSFRRVFVLLGFGNPGLMGLLVGLGAAAAGVGIANDRRAAWYGGIVVSAIIPLFLLWIVWRFGLGRIFETDFLLSAVFPAAQLAALIHPISRSYVKVYFQ